MNAIGEPRPPQTEDQSSKANQHINQNSLAARINTYIKDSFYSFFNSAAQNSEAATEQMAIVWQSGVEWIGAKLFPPNQVEEEPEDEIIL